MSDKDLSYIIKEWKKQDEKLQSQLKYIDSELLNKVPTIRDNINKFGDKIKKKLQGEKMSNWGISQKTKFVKEFDILFTGTFKFLNRIEEIEQEKPNLTKPEEKLYYLDKLVNVRKYLTKNRGAFDSYLNLEIATSLWQSDKIKDKMPFLTHFHSNEKVESYLIEQINKLENKNIMKKNSPWNTGLFYIFLLVVVFAILATLANVVPLIALPLILIVAILLIGVIGAFQLKNDDKLSDESFLQLIFKTYENFPLIGNLMNRKDKN